MSIVYINKDIPVNNVSRVSDPDEILGDFERTAGGTMRADIVGNGYKRSWELEAIFNTKEEFDAVRNHLRSVFYLDTFFWIDDLGGTAETHSISAFITMEPRRVPFGKDGAWHTSGRSYAMKVREK